MEIKILKWGGRVERMSGKRSTKECASLMCRVKGVEEDLAQGGWA